MVQKYNLQSLDISTDWVVVLNKFYEIDQHDDVPEDDIYSLIYYQEDLLYLTKGIYHLDLGWYGSDNFINDRTGFCIHLFRGENWNNAELLVKYYSNNKQVIVNKINQLLKAVNLGYFDKLAGYKVDDNDPTNQNDFSDMNNYCV